MRHIVGRLLRAIFAGTFLAGTFLAGSAMITPLYATTMYTYTGNPYTTTYDIPTPDASQTYLSGESYTTSMYVSGWFTVATAFGANHDFNTLLSGVFTDYSFFDGRTTLTPANSFLDHIHIGTDATGAINQWNIEIWHQSPQNNTVIGDEWNFIETYYYIANNTGSDLGKIAACTVIDYNSNCTTVGLSTEFDEGINHDSPGSWVLSRSDVSAVPLPAALPLFGSGLAGMGLLVLRRKRKAAAAFVP